MKYDSEAIVRHAYHTAEGSVLDVAGFVGLFAKDGVINLGHAGIKPGAGLESYRGEHLGDLVLNVAKYLPDIHRELYRVNVLGDMVAVELSIQGTFLGPLQHPFRHHPADRSEGRRAVRRLLVPARRQDRKVRLLHHARHHARPNGRMTSE